MLCDAPTLHHHRAQRLSQGLGHPRLFQTVKNIYTHYLLHFYITKYSSGTKLLLPQLHDCKLKHHYQQHAIAPLLL